MCDMLAPTLQNATPLLMLGPFVAVIILGQPTDAELEQAAQVWMKISRGPLVLC